MPSTAAPGPPGQVAADATSTWRTRWPPAFTMSTAALPAPPAGIATGMQTGCEVELGLGYTAESDHSPDGTPSGTGAAELWALSLPERSVAVTRYHSGPTRTG